MKQEKAVNKDPPIKKPMIDDITKVSGSSPSSVIHSIKAIDTINAISK